MKVLIVGSMRHVTEPSRSQFSTDTEYDKALEEFTKVTSGFKAACRDIGQALGKAGYDVIVGSEREDTADRHVVDGLAETPGRTVVFMKQQSTDTSHLDELAKKHKVLIQMKPVYRGWPADRFDQIDTADAAVVIGGEENTFLVGYVAPEKKKPVVAIPLFKGAAEKVWRDLGRHYDGLGKVSKEVGRLNQTWKEGANGNGELVVELIRELIRRGVFKERSAIPDWAYFATLVVLLGGWVSLFTNLIPDVSGAWSFYLMMGIAGLLGSSLRNRLRLVKDPTATLSTHQIWNEAGAGLILGFGLSLVYFVGAITVTGKVEPVLAGVAGDFQRVGVVMTLLGLAAGLMLEHAADRLVGWFRVTFWSAAKT